MSSAIDATKPTAGTALTADVRANFAAAKSEIEELQASTTAVQIHNGADIATPDDSDEFGFWDSVTVLLQKITWANLKTALFNAPAVVSQTISGSAGNLYSGTYTPTIVNGTNVAATTPYSTAIYTRIGAQVHYSIPLSIDLTAAGEFALTISLPIASDFTSNIQGHGGGFSVVGAPGAITGTGTARILSDATNNVLQVYGYTAETADRVWVFVGVYSIV